MPIGFNSPARNLFLLGSSGSNVATNFFHSVDRSALTDGVWTPNGIRYSSSDQKYVLSGTASDSQSQTFGWLEKRNYDGELVTSTSDYENRIQSTIQQDVSLRDIELDDNDNLIVVGKSGTVPWIAKYSNAGVLDWQSTTNTGDLEYTGVTSDSNGNYYACGNTPVLGQEAVAFVEKFDADGNPTWGKSAIMVGRDVVLHRIAANSLGGVVAVGYIEDDSKTKGYIVKIDTSTGEVLWDRTLENYLSSMFVNRPTLCEDVFIDSADYIYIVGRLFDLNFTIGFIVKYSPEGNIIWQRQTDASKNIEYYAVNSSGDGGDSTVLGRYYDGSTNNWSGLLTKYRSNGDIAWRRTLTSSTNNSDSFGKVGGESLSLDGDPSFSYIIFTDDLISGLNGTPDKYTFGKISSSGNGLGQFTYYDGVGSNIDYTVSSHPDEIGKLYDGSVRNDTSDLTTYPFRANKILFDDLATHVSNKRRQMDGPDSFEYSGSPAIRPADFQELNLLGDVYSGSGNWLDQSGKGNDGVVVATTSSNAGGVYFDGNGDYLQLVRGSNTGLAFGTQDFTIEFFANFTKTGMRIMSTGDNGNYTTGGWVFETNSKFGAATATGSFGYYGTAFTYPTNSWGHVAVVRSGSNLYGFVDGIEQWSTTITIDIGFGGTNDFSLGTGRSGGSGLGSYNLSSSFMVEGAVSNLRIVKGTALYTANFTPPTTSLTAISGTELLICQGNTIADASSNNFAITVNGDPSDIINDPLLLNVVAPSSSHNAAGGYWEFDGTDDTIDLGTTPLIASNSDFTVEGWCLVDALANECSIFEISSDTTSAAILLSAGSIADGSVGGRFFVRTDSGSELGMRNPSGLGHSTGEWHHYVGTHINSSSNLFSTKLYVDGVEVMAADTFAGNHDFTFSGVTAQQLGLSSGTDSGASVGSEVVFNTGQTVTGGGSVAFAAMMSSVYDPVNQKVVIAYVDEGNASGAGTARVGTVSGTSITFGPEVVFNATQTSFISATYDSTNGKVVIVYNDVTNSNTATAIVGTVSGNSISFGTEVAFSSTSVGHITCTYDSANQKVVAFCTNTFPPQTGTAFIGAVSGTSITFGSGVEYDSGNAAISKATYDSVNQKVVVIYNDASNGQVGTARVGTVSGTSISFGSKVVFNNARTTENSCLYDSTNGKVVIAFRDYGNNSKTAAIVGTVSGTSISFGSKVLVSNGQSYYSMSTYNSTDGTVFVGWNDTMNQNFGTGRFGTVSGTSISFGSPVIYHGGTTNYNAFTYDPTNDKVIIAYQDDSNSGYRTAVVLTNNISRFLDGRIGEFRIYPRALTAAQVYQNYNATKSKYINEAPDTAPKIGPGIVYDSNLLLNYDFGNRATYDRAENLVASSEDFSGSEWGSGGSQGKCDVINTDIISPFGTKNVQLLDDTATGTDGQATDENINIPASNSQDYCFSVYAKKGTADKFDLYLFYTQTSVVGYRLTYVWDTDFITGAGAEGANGVAPNYGYEDVGNGWYRFWLSASDQNLNTQVQARIYPASRDTGPTGSTYFWGAQVEKGSTPGRYIKTSGTAITAPTTVKNLSSSSIPGTINGATFDSDGYFDFDGTDDGMTVNSLPNFTNITVEWWGTSNYPDSNYSVPVMKTTNTGWQDGFGFYQQSGVVSWWVNQWNGGGVTETQTSTTSFGFTHWVGTYDGTNVKMYKNGVLENSASFTTAMTNPNVSFDIGNSKANYYWDGNIGEVRIYDTALSATEVSQNFNATRGKYGV